jgi:D-galactarolactone cycloisomerase
VTLEIAAFGTRLLRVPLQDAVPTPMGRMRERAALFVCVAAPDGAVGWGEVFANWPPGGSRHRRRLLHEVFGPALAQREFASPTAFVAHLERATRLLRLQCDEPGPIDQCIAGLATAAWDLAAVRAGKTLAALLRETLDREDPPAQPQRSTPAPNGSGEVGSGSGGSGSGSGDPPPAVPVYVSGLRPAVADAEVVRWRGAGVAAYKLMVGVRWRDALPVLARIRAREGRSVALMVDANQGWDLAEALAAVAALREFEPAWVEEPLPVDAPLDDWRRLAEATDLPLAGGENLRGERDFDAAIAGGVLRVIQPDVIKWGGVERVASVGRRALRAGLRFCPHYLGGPVGYRASAHVLAATGGDGLLETDANGHLLAGAASMPLRLTAQALAPLEALGPPGPARLHPLPLRG